MTVIAWDGKTLAGDRQSQAGGMRSAVRKIERIRGHLVGGSGHSDHVREHMAWFADGADPLSFPPSLRADNCPSILLVITPARTVLAYEQTPYPIEILDRHYAIGSGRDFAMTAMFLGFDAVKGVEAANALSTTCGLGCDNLTLEENE